MVNNMLPYLPDIFKKVVARVNTELKKKNEDAKEVLFGHGVYSQVWKDVQPGEKIENPLIWLVMNFDEEIGASPMIAYQALGLQIIISMWTDPAYSQEEREKKVFFPVLIPVYDELMKQIRLSIEFGFPNERDLRHRRTLRPYWGGGEADGISAPNLWKTNVDAIQIRALNLNVKKTIC